MPETDLSETTGISDTSTLIEFTIHECEQAIQGLFRDTVSFCGASEVYRDAVIACDRDIQSYTSKQQSCRQIAAFKTPLATSGHVLDEIMHKSGSSNQIAVEITAFEKEID